ncbi:hypothetical protein ACOMHN_008799 [Nucella lapillus]
MESSGYTYREKVDEKEVMQMNAAKIFELAGQRSLSLQGCNNVEEFRERTLLHLRVEQGSHYDMQSEFGSGSSEASDSTRQTLDGLLDTVQTAITDLSPTLEHALRTDSTESDKTATLVQQIKRRRHSLMTSECSVIVAGETNAGKSTFLNILLGMDVLPTSIFSCTAAVCVLRYSPATFRVRIHSRDGKQLFREFKDAQSTKTWLKTMAAMEDEDTREKGLDINSIHVDLPAAVLQCGVTLVDTPGIGENDAMTRCTMDYVKQHSAAAYLYVIKTDNAGGVHEDRLLDFLRAILHYNEQSLSEDTFSSSSAMFVCNRWDQVPADQRERVRDNALTKLKDVWPKFQSRQAFFMSSTRAQMHFDSDPRYITQDYEQVLKGLKEMFGQAGLNTLNHHYRWLKLFLHDSTTFLQTAVHHCALSDEDLMARFKSTGQRLQALEQRTADTTQQLRQHVDRAMQRLCRFMRQILQDEDVKKDLLDWHQQVMPPSPSKYTPDEGSELSRKFKERNEVKRWQEDVDTIIMRRIMETVDTHIAEKGLDKEVHHSLRTTFQQELKLVDEEINLIVKDLTDTSSLSSSTSSNSSCTSTDVEDDLAQELLRMYRERDLFRVHQLKHVSKVTSSHSPSSSSPSSSAMSTEMTISRVPKMMLGRMVARVLGPLATLGKNVQRARKTSLFLSHPTQYMKERTEKIVRVVCDKEGFVCLHQMAAKYHEKMDAFISDVENSIPSFIANNKQQMDDIKRNRKDYLSRRNELIALMEKMEPVRNLLQGFGALYIRDLTADNIGFVLDAEQRRESISVKVKEVEHKEHTKLSKDSGLGNSQLGESRKSSLGSGPWGAASGGSLWSTFTKGHVTIGPNKEDLMGRTYIQLPGERALITEIARLRCLRCDDLAPFLGMTHVADQAVFLFRGDLKSARRLLSRGFHEPSESVPRLLEGVVRGLHYLHREGLVHMELSQDTVMVNAEGEPRLCGACLPRRARLPPDANLICAEPFVCLSPEVLRDELYIAEDDVYSFGLLVWEMCLQEKPYRLYRNSLNLQEFRTQVHPSSMLGLDAFNDVTKTMASILRGCLLPARGLRMKMTELKERVQDLRHCHTFSANDVAADQNEQKGSKETLEESFARNSISKVSTWM